MPDQEKPLLDHVSELRRRVIFTGITVLILSFVAYYWVTKKEVIDFLTKPVGKLVFLAPHEAFMTYLGLSIYGGIILASPIIIFQIWRFVSIGLTPKERKYIRIFGPLSVVSFLGGASFAFFIIIPLGLKFLLGFASESLAPMISVKNYLSFGGMLLITFGLVFELPLVMMFLSRIGVISPRVMRSKRREVIIGIFVAAAILTPPDVVTQLLMACPLILLFEIGVIFSSMAYRKKKKPDETGIEGS